MTCTQLGTLAKLIRQIKNNGNHEHIPKAWLHKTRTPSNWADKEWFEVIYLNDKKLRKLKRVQVRKILRQAHQIANLPRQEDKIKPTKSIMIDDITQTWRTYSSGKTMM